jgi:hypothetical protein
MKFCFYHIIQDLLIGKRYWSTRFNYFPVTSDFYNDERATQDRKYWGKTITHVDYYIDHNRVAFLELEFEEAGLDNIKVFLDDTIYTSKKDQPK